MDISNGTTVGNRRLDYNDGVGLNKSGTVRIVWKSNRNSNVDRDFANINMEELQRLLCN